MAPYMVKFKKTRKIIIFLAYEHRMPVVSACETSEASVTAGTTGKKATNDVAGGDPEAISLLESKSR